jgi:hypothetical protein
MPRVTMRTGFIGADGQDEELSEFVCDAPRVSQHRNRRARLRH